LKGLRKYGVNDLCKLCRARLPAGPMAMMDGGLRLAGAAEATKDGQLRRRRYADAAVLLRQALAEDSSLAKAHYALGYALSESEVDIDGAEVAYRAAIECDPKHVAGARVNLGVLLENDRQDIDGAEAVYRAAIVYDPKHATFHNNLGNLLQFNRQDIDGAEAAYRAAIECDSKHVNAHGALGELLLDHRGAFAEAEALFRRTIKLTPRDVRPHVGLGFALAGRAHRRRGGVPLRTGHRPDQPPHTGGTA
jgi:tetratricopeptide (TPR) repeat protein